MVRGEQELNKLKIFQKSESLFIIFDKTGIIKDVNERSYKFLGLSRKSLLGKSAWEILELLGFPQDQALKLISKGD